MDIMTEGGLLMFLGCIILLCVVVVVAAVVTTYVENPDFP